MKTNYINSAIAFVFIITLTSCYNDNNVISEPYTFTSTVDKTTKEYQVSIMALNNENLPISGVEVKLYTQNPLNANGTLKTDNENYLIHKGITNEGGVFNCSIAPQTNVDSLTIYATQTGVSSLLTVQLKDTEINVQICCCTSK